MRRAMASLLMIDAFDDEREMYAEYLRLNGFDVRAYGDVAQAVGAALDWQPDVVVTRLRQYGNPAGGIDVTRRLKHAAPTRHVPVVMITTSILDSDRVAAGDAHCDAYLLLELLKLQDLEVHFLLQLLALRDLLHRAHQP